MRKIIFGAFIILSVNIFSQDIGELYFKEAQPYNAKNENIIPGEFHGKYSSTRDSLLTIIITADSIYFNQAQLYIFKSTELKEKGWTLNEQGISGFVQNRIIPALVKGDTIYTFLIQSQTFFSINDTSVIKQNQNILYINKRISADKWATCVIKKENNKLILAYIDTDNKNEKKALTTTKPIKTQKNMDNEPVYIFNMSKSDRGKYLDTGGCSSESDFVKK